MGAVRPVCDRGCRVSGLAGIQRQQLRGPCCPITLTRITEQKLEKIRVENRTGLDAEVKAEFIHDLDTEIERLERRAECLEEIMQTKEHRKC